MGWRYRSGFREGAWLYTEDDNLAKAEEAGGNVVQPLYASPPAQAGAVTEDEGCTSVNLVFSEGILRVNKDGSGYILVSEHDFELETEYDDDGNRSDFWITRFPSGEMKELKDFLNKVLASA